MHYATETEVKDRFGTKGRVLGTKGKFLTKRELLDKAGETEKLSYSKTATTARLLLWYTRHPRLHG